MDERIRFVARLFSLFNEYCLDDWQTRMSKKHLNSSNLDIVYEYHDQTKHQLQRYARSLGYMDWKNQPDPFRRYDQASILPLNHPPSTETPSYDSLFEACRTSAARINRDSVSRLFYESLAISAWKQAGGNRWSLRVNPSSGNLHPTEAYLIAGPVQGLSEASAVYHYSAYRHALERQAVLAKEEWHALSHGLPPDFLMIALTSIHWRESWKYGERAFRYCHHDVGHAIGAVTFAAAALGWETRLIHCVTDTDLKTLLGLHQQEGIEAEHPDCLLAVYPFDTDRAWVDPLIDLPVALLERLKTTEFEGNPNLLSDDHHDWPIIGQVAKACRSNSPYRFNHKHHSRTAHDLDNELNADRRISARRIMRERRSALSMDGHGAISSDTFYRLLAHVTPYAGNNILEVLPWRACISLAIFVHRVEGLQAGLYMLVRDPAHEASLKKALHPELCWEKPDSCPKALPLYLLQEADTREVSKIISCHQDIAADGAFALGMLAAFDASLEQHGAQFYTRLFWETGLIGQILYLEAEAAGIRSTGIGCFFDDVMHEVLGISDHGWQSLYHFTVGTPVEDARLQPLPAYWHLKDPLGDGAGDRI